MIYILATIHGLLQLFDWYSTSVILKAGGREQNSVMAFVFKYVNVDVAMCIKMILFTILGILLGATPLEIDIVDTHFVIPEPYLLLPLIAVYSWVAYHNWKSL